MFESLLWERARKAEVRRNRRLAKARDITAAADPTPAFFVRRLKAGERVFASGGPKEWLCRVESGLVGISWTSPAKTVEPIEKVKPGSFFGLGYLDYHLYDAVSLSDSSISFWPRSALDFIIAQFPESGARQADAVEREFRHRRAALAASSATDTPAARLAGFLSIVSRVNAVEGRDPHVISEAMRCPVVADYLKIDVDTLGKALVVLQRNGIVAVEPPNRLRICDLSRLEHFSAGLAAPSGEAGHAP